MSAGLNLEIFTILSGTNSVFDPRLKFKLRLKFFKFGLKLVKISVLGKMGLTFSAYKSVHRTVFKFPPLFLYSKKSESQSV